MANASNATPSQPLFDARDDAGLDELYETVLQLKDIDDCRRFFVDLCTPAELHSLRDRWRVARLVSQGFPYREIHDLTGVSTATITRVGRTLNYGSGGYQALLERGRRRASNRVRKLHGGKSRQGSKGPSSRGRRQERKK